MTAAEPPAGRISAWWLVAPTVLFAGNFLAALSVHTDQSNLVYHVPDILATAAVDLVLAGYALMAARSSDAGVAGVLALRRVPPATGARLALGVFAFLTVVDLLTDPLLHAGKRQGIAPTHPPHGRHEWIALGLAVVALVVVAPVAEELIFRGLCFAAMGRYALPGSAALFALAHGLPVLLAPVFVAGLVIGWLRARTGSLYPGLAVHMLLNATALAAALATA
jgi:membrane protease YdiL (CAAX protease family)